MSIIDVRVSGTLPADPHAVWRSLCHPEQLAAWWPQLTLEPELGGGFLELLPGGDGAERRTTGNVTTWVEPELIELEWADEDWTFITAVSIRLESTDGETRVSIQHGGWEAAGAEAAELQSAYEDGWQRHLHRWRSYLRSATGA